MKEFEFYRQFTEHQGEPGLTPSMAQDIFEFHAKFGLLHLGGPRMLPADLEQFRIKFMQEELDEYIKACNHQDAEKAFDALLDLVYVAMGTALLHSFPWAEGWRRVQEANMAKVRAEHAEDERSVRKHASDVVKPEGWKAPDHSDLVLIRRPCDHDWQPISSHSLVDKCTKCGEERA